MTKYIIVGVSKTELGAGIVAFSSGNVALEGFPVTEKRIKKYDSYDEAKKKVGRLRRLRPRYNIFVQDVEIPSNGTRTKTQAQYSRAYQHSLSF